MTSIAENHGPLIESGRIDNVTYEVRGTTHPMIYLSRTANGRPVAMPTQLGGTPAGDLARILMAEAGIKAS